MIDTKTDSTHFIGVRVTVPDGAVGYPADNIAGTMLLMQLLSADAVLDGVNARPWFCGPLNKLVGVVEVDDLQRGLLLVEGLFSKLGISGGFLELAWLDEGRTWRSHPDNTYSALNEAIGPDFAKLEDALTRQIEQLKLNRKS
ncbi:MAG TPA: hypothetical protein VFZ59_01700 [Verrucomicrobiae bacterium]|nr:hypothetical protein [Verrucomicrobiae bacterium]